MPSLASGSPASGTSLARHRQYAAGRHFFDKFFDSCDEQTGYQAEARSRFRPASKLHVSCPFKGYCANHSQATPQGAAIDQGYAFRR